MKVSKFSFNSDAYQELLISAMSVLERHSATITVETEFKDETRTTLYDVLVDMLDLDIILSDSESENQIKIIYDNINSYEISGGVIILYMNKCKILIYTTVDLEDYHCDITYFKEKHPVGNNYLHFKLTC